jgi:hypothetical protein
VLKVHVVIVCFKCFKGMLKAFYIDVAKVDRDVAKVDRDVAHVAMAIYVYFKCMFYVFHLDVAKVDLDVVYICMLQASVSGVLYICCKCFVWMLHMFCNCYTRVFKYFLGVCKCFRCTLQVHQLFWMYVASVSSGCCKNRSGVIYVAMDPPTAVAYTC